MGLTSLVKRKWKSISFSAVGSWSIHGCQRPVFIWHINLAMTKWIAERLHKDFCLQAQGGKMFKPNCYSDIIGASRVSVSLCLAKSHFFGFLLLWTRRFKGTVADIKQSLDSAPRQKRCLEYLPFNGIVCQIVVLIWSDPDPTRFVSLWETHTVRKSSASSSFAYDTQNPTGVKQPWQKLFFPSPLTSYNGALPSFISHFQQTGPECPQPTLWSL